MLNIVQSLNLELGSLELLTQSWLESLFILTPSIALKKPTKVWLVVSSIMEVEFLAVVFIQKTEENVTILTVVIVDGMLATISLIAFLLFKITTL